MGKVHHCPVWVEVTPAEDVPGEWVSHCLDLDVMSQGRSVSHALEMMFEAVTLVLQEDARAGVNPLDRRAPESDWAAFYERFRGAELVSATGLDGDDTGEKFSWVATQLMIYFPESLTSPPRVEPKSQAVVQHARAAA